MWKVSLDPSFLIVSEHTGFMFEPGCSVNVLKSIYSYIYSAQFYNPKNLGKGLIFSCLNKKEKYSWHLLWKSAPVFRNSLFIISGQKNVVK